MSEEEQIRELTEAAFWSKVHRGRKDNPHTVTAEQVGADELGESLAGHFADVSNPHEVTAEQVGAALASALSDHLADVSNPHEVTADQLGIASGAGDGAIRQAYHPVWHRADVETISGLDGMWMGGVLAPNGKIYGMPASGGSVLIIDPETDTADTTTISGLDWMWMGGVLAPNGKIYGVPGPDNDGSVLIIDPETDTADTTTISDLVGVWAGGILAPNGKIYGMPLAGGSVLIITPGMPTMPIDPLLSPYLNKF